MAVPQLFLVRKSAIDLVVHNIAELRSCGLKLRMPTFGRYTFYFFIPFVVIRFVTSLYVLSFYTFCRYTLCRYTFRHRTVFHLGCPIFASFNYSLRSEQKRIQFLFTSNSLCLANIRFKTKRISASKYSLQFALICFKIFASEQSECKKFTSQKGAKQ